jgi:hypothetical protein
MKERQWPDLLDADRSRDVEKAHQKSSWDGTVYNPTPLSSFLLNEN